MGRQGPVPTSALDSSNPVLTDRHRNWAQTLGSPSTWGELVDAIIRPPHCTRRPHLQTGSPIEPHALPQEQARPSRSPEAWAESWKLGVPGGPAQRKRALDQLACPVQHQVQARCSVHACQPLVPCICQAGVAADGLAMQDKMKLARTAEPAQPAGPPADNALLQACQALQARNRFLEHSARIAFEHGQQLSEAQVGIICRRRCGQMADVGSPPAVVWMHRGVQAPKRRGTLLYSKLQQHPRPVTTSDTHHHVGGRHACQQPLNLHVRCSMPLPQLWSWCSRTWRTLTQWP